MADRIRNKDIHRMAGTSEDVTVRMKNVKTELVWARRSDERMAKKNCVGKVSGKRGLG